MQKIEELIAALEMATGPDRWLDARIAASLEPHRFDAAGFTPIRPIQNFWMDKSEGTIRFEGGGLMDVRFFPAVTGSLDAAVALVERVLPDAFWMMSRGRLRIEEPLYAVQLLFGSEEILSEAEGNSLPVTICLATLRAKLAQEKNNADK